MVGKALNGSPPNSSTHPRIINLPDKQSFVNSKIFAFYIITDQCDAQHLPMCGGQFAVAATDSTDSTQAKIFNRPGSKPYEPKFTTSSASVFAACKDNNKK